MFFFFFRVYVSWPRAHNPNSPHISEPISFHFSSENLVIRQELSSTLISISVEERGNNELRFLTFISEMFLGRTYCSVFIL